MRSAISAYRKPEMENVSPHFVDEDLNSVPTSGIPEEFRKLSRFVPVIVLIPKSAVSDKSDDKDARPNQPVACSSKMEMVDCLLDAPEPWFRSPGVSDTVEFGVITGCFSPDGNSPQRPACDPDLQGVQNSPVPVQESSEGDFTRRTYQRGAGIPNYPCTRTVDNHILKLRKRLETDPAHPKHLQSWRWLQVSALGCSGKLDCPSGDSQPTVKGIDECL